MWSWGVSVLQAAHPVAEDSLPEIRQMAGVAKGGRSGGLQSRIFKSAALERKVALIFDLRRHLRPFQ